MELDFGEESSRYDTSSDGTTATDYAYTSKVVLPDFYPKLTEIRSPKHKLLVKKVTIEGEGSFDAEVYRKDYDHKYFKSHDRSLKDLDLTVASRVGNTKISILDSSVDNFKVSSIIVEGMLTVSSKELT
jgi:hypothetical protein